MASQAMDSRPITAPSATAVMAAPPVARAEGRIQTSHRISRPSSISVRRRIPPTSGHALEKLGHAIEYLTDEYVHNGCVGEWQCSQVQAIETLMAANRQVYYECPIVLTLWQRLQSFISQSLEA